MATTREDGADSMEDVVRHLSESLFFQQLGHEELYALAQCGSRFAAPAETEIIRRGDEGDALYLVLDGGVRVTIPEASGAEFVVARLGRGSIFGELSLLVREPRSATVITVVDSTLFMIRRNDFHRLLLQHQALLAWLLAGLSRRVRESTSARHQDEIGRRLVEAQREIDRHRAITSMVTGIAHELNTPLGVCVTAASMISEWLGTISPALAEGDAEWFGDVVDATSLLIDNINRCSSLVRSFTEIAALQRGEAKSSVDLRELIDSVVASFPLVQRHGLKSVEIRIDTASPDWRGCRHQLGRVLTQLLANIDAHAYGPEGDPEARAEIVVADDRLRGNPALRFEIRDFGAGIPPEVLPHVYDAFYTTGRGRGHKGLGLTIAYNAVTGPLAGTIALDSAPGRGTTATVIVPRE